MFTAAMNIHYVWIDRAKQIIFNDLKLLIVFLPLIQYSYVPYGVAGKIFAGTPHKSLCPVNRTNRKRMKNTGDELTFWKGPECDRKQLCSRVAEPMAAFHRTETSTRPTSFPQRIYFPLVNVKCLNVYSFHCFYDRSYFHLHLLLFTTGLWNYFLKQSFVMISKSSFSLISKQ